ncbi:MAG: chloride channel protein [Jatrophihabitans sp.]|nr:MAG: chloride channel protein [Jatrophihabitans sp.]
MTRDRWRFPLAAVLTGVAAGVAGIALTLLLRAVEHLTFGYTEGSLLVGVRDASPVRRVVALALAGAVVGVAWWAQRRWLRGNVSVTHALAGEPRLPVAATIADAAIQISSAGAGASLGREGAPRQAAAAVAAWLAQRLGLDREQRRLLLACGAGAGLAAVYNVPLSGVAFTLEILLVRDRLRAFVPALVTSAVGTVVAWTVLGDRPTYHVPHVHGGLDLLWTGLAIAPVSAAAGLAFRAVMTRCRTVAPRGRRTLLMIPAAFAILGALGVAYPELLGNGKSLAQLALTGGVGAGAAAALAPLKAVATAMCLRAGAIGGLLTPSFATGAALGVALAAPWSALVPGVTPGAVALLGAATMLSVTQRGPVTAVLLGLEFTHPGFAALPALVLAVAATAAVARVLPRLRPEWARPARTGGR